MGAKQSKRSVDISGKEAENGGEVVAAAGEGRVEPLADIDSLKPQLNGDAPHIEPPDEKTDKEKQLENGTPENEKDATTEKEEKARETEKGNESPVTNGETDAKADPENGEASPVTTPEQDSAKKPKKEKVKKKWSLRSISFSRKDKQKPEKKAKEEEPKTNGEPEQVPEEATEATVEATESKVEVEKIPESNEEKSPEASVTEPLTNGSSAPETPKDVTPLKEEPAVASVPEKIPEEPKVELKPEQLPLNGLSLEEEKKDLPETEAKVESSKPQEEVAPVAMEKPAPETPVKTEVCVEKIPLVESSPPPLPANPPPSSVASFAVSTMAPHLADTTLINDTANLEPSAPTDTAPINAVNIPLDTQDSTQNAEEVPSVEDIAETQITESIPPPTVEDETIAVKDTEEKIVEQKNADMNNAVSELVPVDETIPEPVPITEPETALLVEPEEIKTNGMSQKEEIVATEIKSDDVPIESVEDDKSDDDVMMKSVEEKIISNLEEASFPPPPPHVEEEPVDTLETIENAQNNFNGLGDVVLDNGIQLDEQDNKINKISKAKIETENIIESVECNGNMCPRTTESIKCEIAEMNGDCKAAGSPDDSVPPSLSAPVDSSAADEVSESFPLPPSELCTEPASPTGSPGSPDLQESVPVPDKLDVVVPEVAPEIPSTDIAVESSTDVEVTN